MVCLIIWARHIVVFTPRDEHSQGEHPHNSLHSRDCTYKINIAVPLQVANSVTDGDCSQPLQHNFRCKRANSVDLLAKRCNNHTLLVPDPGLLRDEPAHQRNVCNMEHVERGKCMMFASVLLVVNFLPSCSFTIKHSLIL